MWVKSFPTAPDRQYPGFDHKRLSAEIPVGLQTSLGVFARFSFEEPIGYIEPPLPGHSTRPPPKEQEWKEAYSPNPFFPNSISKPRTHRQIHAVYGRR